MHFLKCSFSDHLYFTNNSDFIKDTLKVHCYLKLWYLQSRTRGLDPPQVRGWLDGLISNFVAMTKGFHWWPLHVFCPWTTQVFFLPAKIQALVDNALCLNFCACFHFVKKTNKKQHANVLETLSNIEKKTKIKWHMLLAHKNLIIAYSFTYLWFTKTKKKTF